MPDHYGEEMSCCYLSIQTHASKVVNCISIGLKLPDAHLLIMSMGS